MKELQTNTETRQEWIEYSARDALATHGIYKSIKASLQAEKWIVGGEQLGSMFDFYIQYLKDFGEVLTDMERNGIKVDTTGT
jgi:DNA polymerase-1